MDISYAIDFALYNYYTKDSITTILKNGSELGFLYFVDRIHFQPLDITQAAETLYMEKFPYDDDLPEVAVKCKDTDFIFLPYCNEKNALEISFFNFGIDRRWRKDFAIGIADIYFDLARYMRLFLSLLKDFTITKTTTEIEY